MAEAKIYPKGIVTFAKNEKAPDFVLGTIIINPKELIDWMNQNQNLLAEYKGEKQLRLQALNGNKGLYLVVDTYKKENNVVVNQADSSLPF